MAGLPGDTTPYLHPEGYYPRWVAPPVADTLPAQAAALPTDSTAADTLWVSPDVVFGTGSAPLSSIQADIPAPPPRPFTDSGVYQGTVVAVALGYCLILYYFRAHAGAIIGLLRGSLYTDAILEEANHTLLRFLNLSSVLGLLALAAGVVHIAQATAGQELIAALPGRVVTLAAPIAAVVLGTMLLYRHVIITLAGQITLSEGFTYRLWHLRRMIVALGGLFTTPVLLLGALHFGTARTIVLGLVGALFAASWLLLLLKSYRLFATMGVPILHWFLYLCAVELFPVSLLIGIVIANR